MKRIPRSQLFDLADYLQLFILNQLNFIILQQLEGFVKAKLLLNLPYQIKPKYLIALFTFNCYLRYAFISQVSFMLEQAKNDIFNNLQILRIRIIHFSLQQRIQVQIQAKDIIFLLIDLFLKQLPSRNFSYAQTIIGHRSFLNFPKRMMQDYDISQFKLSFILWTIISLLKAEMFTKQLQKINNLLNDAKQASKSTFDSVSLISTSLTRPTTTSFKSANSRCSPKYSKQITLIKEQLSSDLQRVLILIFKSKCKDLEIEFNEHNWQTFIKTFFVKNKFANLAFSDNNLNLSNLSLGPNSIEHINNLAEMYSIEKLNLTKNLVNPIKLANLTSIKQLILKNCKLGNDILQQLFDKLQNSPIQKISLSSPQLKDRNQLTKYQKLIQLIKNSKTLTCLQLSNTQINPNNAIMQNCRNTSLKKLDLSDNTNVRGVCPTLYSLNLSKNGISAPFDFPLAPLELQYLNLSYNKIPFYHFKQFLKVNYLPALKCLILDHLKINGQVYPLQNFLQQSLSITFLSVVDCDLSPESYMNIANGVKNSRVIRFIDLTRNRIASDQVAKYVSNMLQSSSLIALRMRHCDIKDKLGEIIFSGLHTSRSLESIDIANNLLGDKSARMICNELKTAKNILVLNLQQNIIKYNDMQEIKSYLQGNKYYGQYQLNQQYSKLNQINRQLLEIQRNIKIQELRVFELAGEVDKLDDYFYEKFKVENQLKKKYLKDKIEEVRKGESQLQQQLFLRETLLVPSLTDKLSMKEPYPQNPENPIINQRD